jgi:hypothetical protein
MGSALPHDGCHATTFSRCRRESRFVGVFGRERPREIVIPSAHPVVEDVTHIEPAQSQSVSQTEELVCHPHIVEDGGTCLPPPHSRSTRILLHSSSAWQPLAVMPLLLFARFSSMPQPRPRHSSPAAAKDPSSSAPEPRPNASVCGLKPPRSPQVFRGGKP